MKPKVKITITEAEQLQSKKKSLFERFYDGVGNFLSGGKSFVPGELKSFV